MKLSDFLVGVGRPVAYYPGMARMLDDMKEAVFICQMAYWKDKGDDPEGWIYKTSEEIEQETALSYKEQCGVREGLVKKELLEEYYARTEHKMYFRVDWDAVNEMWEKHAESEHLTKSKMPKHTPESKVPPSQKSDGTLPNVSSLNSNTEITTENTSGREKFSNPLWDLQHGKTPKFTEKDKDSEALEQAYKSIAERLEVGLRRGEFPQTTKAQVVYRWIAKKEENGQPLDRFIQWAMRDEKAASFSWVYYDDLDRIKRDWPQAFPANTNPNERQASSFYG